jgi:hypothetical protein
MAARRDLLGTTFRTYYFRSTSYLQYRVPVGIYDYVTRGPRHAGRAASAPLGAAGGARAAGPGPRPWRCGGGRGAGGRAVRGSGFVFLAFRIDLRNPTTSITATATATLYIHAQAKGCFLRSLAFSLTNAKKSSCPGALSSRKLESVLASTCA